MLYVIEFFFFLFLIVLAIPVATFSLQILVSVLPSFRPSSFIGSNKESHQTDVALLIPAHNESSGITATLLSIKAQASDKTRIIVIADNCTDDTAAVALQHGVEVIERFHATERGKGYALDFGIKHLAASPSPPQVMIVFDADCLLGANAINALVQATLHHNRPIQALYLIQAKPGSNMKTKLAEFAYVVKSWARLLGAYRLGLPCQLMGSGMAFPWEQIKHANLAGGYIVEDMKLGIDFATKRQAPKFCAEAFVSSEFPLNEEGAQSQRQRWEHGHMGMIVKEGLPLLFNGLKSFNLEMVAMALDLCVPPLALLFLMTAGFALISAVGLLATASLVPWVYGIALFGILGLFVLISWVKFGRKILPFYNLVTYAPVYAVSKIQLYVKFFINRQVEWVKSRRD